MTKVIPTIQAEPNKKLETDSCFFVIIKRDGIQVEHYQNVIKENNRIVSGILKTVFKGKNAEDLCHTILQHIPILLESHCMYLGRELQKAEDRMEYVQDE